MPDEERSRGRRGGAPPERSCGGSRRPQSFRSEQDGLTTAVTVRGLGRPGTVAESQRLGRAAVLAMLRVAGRCPAAVLDSTWFGYTRPLVAALPGRVVELRTVVPVEVARSRYAARAATRHPGHLDTDRSADELWGEPVPPLGAGPLIEVDTTGPVDIPALAARIRATR